jgi:hypothetical protein
MWSDSYLSSRCVCALLVLMLGSSFILVRLVKPVVVILMGLSASGSSYVASCCSDLGPFAPLVRVCSVINDNHMLVTNLCFEADFYLGYCHEY